MNRRRRKIIDWLPWFKNQSLALNGVAPSLIHDYGNNRYYNTAVGSSGFPFTATRTTNATMFNNAGQLVWAPANMVSQSTSFSASAATVGVGIAGPDGIATALVTGDGLVSPHFFYAGVATTVTGGKYTVAAVIKTIDTQFIQLAVSSTANSAGYVNFELLTLTSNITASGLAGGASNPKIVDFGNGFVRVSMDIVATGVGGGASPLFAAIDSLTASRVPSYAWSGSLYVGMAQMEPTSVYSPGAYVRTTGSGMYCARLDHDPATLLPRGVLVETSSTNSSPNSGLAGGVAGTPGTVPTGWNISAVTGVTITTSYGELDGFPYIDVAYSGTNTSGAAAIPTIRFCPTSSIVAANGETWTTSVHIQQVGGTDSITSHTHGIKSRDSGGTLVSGQAISEALVDAASLKEARHDITFTFSGATVAFIEHTTQRNLAIGASIDITLRIWLPQLEEKAFASSIIPTYGTAATRALDNLTTPVASWLDATKGTMYADFMRRYVAPGAGSSTAFAQIYTDSGNRVVLLCGSGTNSQHRFDVFDATVAQTQQQTSVGGAAMTARKMAGMYILNLFLAAENGASSAGDVLGTVPTMTLLSIGCFGTSGQMDGWVKEFRYYPVGDASNAQLQTLTA